MDDELGNLVDALNEQEVQDPQYAAPGNINVPGLQFTTEFVEATKNIEYEIKVVTGTDNPNVNLAIYDPATGVITVYVHDGFEPHTMLNDRVQKYLQKGTYTMPVNGVVQYNINPTELRTCKFFSASRDSFGGDIPISISKQHDFDKPFAVASCSNDKKLKDIPGFECINQQTQCACPYYEAEKWSVEKHYRSEEQNTDWYLESHRKGIGFKNFKITKCSDIGDQDPIILWSLDVLTDPEAEIKANKQFNAYVDGIIGIVEIPVDKTEEVTTHYYDYAFAGTN